MGRRRRTVRSTPKRGKLSRVEVRRSVEAVVYGRTEKEHYVVANPEGGWDVVRGNALRALKHFDTKKDAVAYGQQVSKISKLNWLSAIKTVIRNEITTPTQIR